MKAERTAAAGSICAWVAWHPTSILSGGGRRHHHFQPAAKYLARPIPTRRMSVKSLSIALPVVVGRSRSLHKALSLTPQLSRKTRYLYHPLIKPREKDPPLPSYLEWSKGKGTRQSSGRTRSGSGFMVVVNPFCHKS